MPIRFRCQDCRSRVKVPEGTQGKQVKCPRCGRIQSVPQQDHSAQADTENLTVHTLVGSIHQAPKRKEALVGAGDARAERYESRGGGGVPGGLNIPNETAGGYSNGNQHGRISRKQRRRMEARAREAALAREAATVRETEVREQDAIDESRKRVADLFATSENKSFDESAAHTPETVTKAVTPDETPAPTREAAVEIASEKTAEAAPTLTARATTPPKPIAFGGNGSAAVQKEPAAVTPATVEATVAESTAAEPAHVVESAPQQHNHESYDLQTSSEPEANWTLDLTSEAYPFLKIIPWVLRVTALMLIGPAFKVMLVADAQGFSGVVSLLVLFMGLALVVVTWTVGEIATAVRDIALKKVTG